jgi:hypothetical protein
MFMFTVPASQPTHACYIHDFCPAGIMQTSGQKQQTYLGCLTFITTQGKKTSKLLRGNHYTYNMISSLTMRRCPGINLWNNNLASFMFPSFLSSFAHRRINNVNAWRSSSLRHFIRQPPCTYKSLNLT